MEVSCQVDTSGFEAACLALAKVTGKSMESVVTSELGRVLDQTISYTPSASKAKIDARFEAARFTAQPPDLYTPRTKVGLKRRSQAHLYKGKLRYNLVENRYPDPLWQSIKVEREKSRKRKYGAIGLARKSWWDIAQRLGLPVSRNRVAKAIATTGKEYPQDISVSKSVQETEIAVAFINAQPTVNLPSVNGRRALQSAINNRVKAFLANLHLGVFKSMEQIAHQYPGLKLNLNG